MSSRAMVIVGGGSSTRFGTDKLMIEIEGSPLVAHTIDAVVAHVDVCVVVCRPEMVETIAEKRTDVIVVPGGASRTLSEMAGLASLGVEADLIGIHDAARPIVRSATIEKLFETARREGGALPILPYDRIILDRATHRPISGLAGAQTPQVFRGPELMSAYVLAAREGIEGHDTVEIVQRFSDVKIVAIEGDPDNIKVTYPEDLEKIRRGLTDSSHT